MSSKDSKNPIKSISKQDKTSTSPLVNGGVGGSSSPGSKSSTKPTHDNSKNADSRTSGRCSRGDAMGASRKLKQSRNDKHNNKNNAGYGYSVNSDYDRGRVKLRIAKTLSSSQPNENSVLSASPASSAAANLRVPSPWRPESPVIETKVVTLQKSPTKSTPVSSLTHKSSPVPDPVSPHQKTNRTAGSRKSSPDSQSTPHNKYSTNKTNSWSAKSSGSPEKVIKNSASPSRTLVPVSSPSPESGSKKKNKLSCLITSLSPKKDRLKATNGRATPPPYLNGDASTTSPTKTNRHASPQNLISPKKPSSAESNSYQSGSPRKQMATSGGVKISSGSSPSSTVIVSNRRNEVTFNGTANNYGSTASTPPGQITTPVRTKAAQKYIPAELLVIPQVVVTPPTPKKKTKQCSANKSNSPAPEKKDTKKKKKSKDKKDKKGKKKCKKMSEPNGYKDVCQSLNKLLLDSPTPPIASPTKSSVQKSSSNNNKDHSKEPFTFAPRKFNNIDVTMSKFPHPRNSFPKVPIASTSHTTSSGRKRKINIVNDKMMRESQQSSQNQRLPLKKRHHHASSSVDKSSASLTLASLSLLAGGNFGAQNHKFGMSTKPDLWKAPIASESRLSSSSSTVWKTEISSDFGELISAQKAKSSSGSSTHSSSKENDIEGIKDEEEETQVGKRSGKKRGRKSKRVVIAPARKRESLVVRKKQQNLVLSPDICDPPGQLNRRSSRVRKPRKLDMEGNGIEEEEDSRGLTAATSSASVSAPSEKQVGSPQKSFKGSPKKDGRRRIVPVEPVVGILAEDQVKKEEKMQDDEVMIIGEVVSPASERGKGKGRKRGISSPVEGEGELAVKRLKGATGESIPAVPDCDSSLNESEISTEVETDGEVTMMSPPSSATSTPLTSPPQQQQTRKRRKVNRTGFPSVKKKKRPQGSSSKIVITPSVTPTPSEGATASVSATGGEVELKMEGVPARRVSIEKKDGIVFISTGKGVQIIEQVKQEEGGEDEQVTSSPTPAFTTMLSTSGFTHSPSERAKMRKRASVDSRLSMGEGGDDPGGNQGEAKPEIPGLILELVHIQNPPVVVPPKNNYLPCGLLSNFFKTEPVPSSSSSGEGNEKTVTPKRVRSCTEKMNPLLPLPPDPESAEFTTTILRDYLLPHDIWCMGVLRARNLYEAWEEQKQKEAEEQKAILAQIKKEDAVQARLARKSTASAIASSTDTNSDAGSSGMGVRPKKPKLPDQMPKSWQYKKLKSNSYYGLSKPPTSTEFESNCMCPDGTGKCASDDCLNRVVYTECPHSCGVDCRNRRIQNHEWAPGIKKMLTTEKGYGVFAMEGIKKGDFILEYVGEVVAEAVFKERMNTIYVNDTHHYCLHLDGGLVIDGHRSGGEGRFVNHSCEPNCEMQKWSVNGLSRMALFALRDIQPNEELSYDYNFTLFNPTEGQVRDR